MVHSSRMQSFAGNRSHTVLWQTLGLGLNAFSELSQRTPSRTSTATRLNIFFLERPPTAS
jgi:hypothetical protein